MPLHYLVELCSIIINHYVCMEIITIMLNDKITVNQIGLTQSDLRLIQTVFKLSADLAKKYQLNTDGLLSSADIVFINTDDADSSTEWDKLAQTNKQCTAIKVTSDTGDSSEHVLTRPLSLKKIMTALQTVTSTERSTSSGANEIAGVTQKILVVDDSYSVRKYMEHKLPELSSANVNVEFADSGEAAMEKLKQQDYDMVFLDVVMPGIDGYQVCKWIKAEKPTYVVMLTSKKSPFDKVRGNMSGCNAYLTKPPKDERLKKVLDKSFKLIQQKKPAEIVSNESTKIHYGT